MSKQTSQAMSLSATRRNSITCGNIWKTNLVHRNQLVCPGSRKALSSYLPDQASTLLKLLDVLDDNDDVQSTAANFEISDEVLENLRIKACWVK